jgi:hypothetical protein
MGALERTVKLHSTIANLRELSKTTARSVQAAFNNNNSDDNRL